MLTVALTVVMLKADAADESAATIRAEARGPDEVKNIARVFNDLMVRLDKYQASLESEVALRTHEARAARGTEESSSFVSDLRAELLAAVPETPEAEEQAAIPSADRPPRALVISGAAGSGKSYLINELRSQAVLAGHLVWILGQRSEYESLVGDGSEAGAGSGPAAQKPRQGKKRAVAPEADTLERLGLG